MKEVRCTLDLRKINRYCSILAEFLKITHGELYMNWEAILNRDE